jgi:hypothetical protein
MKRGFFMKRVLCIAFMALLISSVCSAADTQARFLLTYFMPGDTYTWDNGRSLEAQYVYWKTPNVGFAIALGTGSWNVNDNMDAGYLAGLGPSVARETSGSATVFPLGFSLLYNPDVQGVIKTDFDFGNIPLILEGGLRYMFVNSNIHTTENLGYTYKKENVDINDGLVGLVAADMVFPLPSKIKLSAGFGYQFDIVKGNIKWSGFDLGDNEFRAFFLRLALTLKI